MKSDLKKYLYVFVFAICISAIACIQSCSEIISADIKDETITVLSPPDSLYTNNTKIAFWWENNSMVERFRFQLAQPDFTTPSVLFDTLFSGLQINMTLESAKTTWKVQGKNEGSETIWIERVLFVDTKVPNKATALSLSGDTIASGIVDTLRWISSDVPLSGLVFPVADSIYFSLVNDSVTWNTPYYLDFGISKKYPAENTLGTLAPGNYFWYIVTKDKAGNTKRSDTFKFTVQ